MGEESSRQEQKRRHAWPFPPPVRPMEARTAESLPGPPGWAYEPKWDGFRMLAWAGDAARAVRPRLDSRNELPLLRYFPELEPALDQLPRGCVVDGEIVVVRDGRLDFDALQNRIHPAESRVRLLSRETPARLAVFDLLGFEDHDLRSLPFRDRRRLLAELAASLSDPWDLTPSTEDLGAARRWFTEFEAAGFDGIVAKRLDGPYREGERAMVKIKHRRTVDVVIGGYRLHKEGNRIGSLLFGLYDERGELHFIGHSSGFAETESRDLLARLAPLALPEDQIPFGEHARRPGVESRWTGGKDLSYVPIRPQLVVEISYDQLTGNRFRHATRFERWRPDKNPRDCLLDQLERPAGVTVSDVVVKHGG